ncbi:MAG: hypothetical protein LBC82_05180 [Oscillospiraceae bacterium]|jgi:hypothetical protein|nr:hypothetical protein [Oscillospiraceae bacterium]
MTVGAIGSAGIQTGAVYSSPAMEDVNRINPTDLAQINARDYAGNNNADTIRPVETYEPDTGEQADYAAVNFIRNSFPEPIPESRMQTFSLEEFVEGASSRSGEVQVQSRQAEQAVSESATVQTSYEIAQEDTGFRLTPAQQRGVEEYVRVQNYTDPVSVSMAGAQIVA